MAVLDMPSSYPARGKTSKRSNMAAGEEGRATVSAKKQKRRKKGSHVVAMENRKEETEEELGRQSKQKKEADMEPEEEPGSNTLSGSISGDVCESLMERYARSTAPQHRHLCASAAAMRSFLVDEGIPLTPAAYFSFAIAAACDFNREDRETLSAISAFLSILLPQIPPQSIPPLKALEAASSLISLLENSTPEAMAAPTVRSLVGSLGFLAQSVDLEDWVSVELPLRTLLRFSVDKRPKVRRCAQLSVVDVFRALKCPLVIKNSSKVVHSLFQSHIPLAMKLSSTRNDSKSKVSETADDIEVLHVLSTVKLLVAHMPLKIARACLPDACKLLNGKFSLLTRNVIGLLEVILQKLSDNILEGETETVVLLLTSYLSSKAKKPADTLCSASMLLKDIMSTLCNSQPGIWIKHLSRVFESVAGLVISSPSIGNHCADILRDLINVNLLNPNEICRQSVETSEAGVIISLCSSCENVLSISSSAPNEHILAVISDLFLKLGKHSSLYMSKIVLKLSSWVKNLDEGTSELQNVQQCLGSAIVSMGPENIISILPISFDPHMRTYSNMWLIPILKKHTVGASLKFFLEHIVPLARSAEDKCDTLHKSSAKKKHLALVNAMWSLLPAFCHYPTDTADNFCSLANILVENLKKDPSSHVLVYAAIKELVNENKSQLEANVRQSSVIMKDKCGEEVGYPHEVAQKNIEVLASNSMELFKLLIDMFFDSPPEKRASLKDVIGCLASILDSLELQSFLSSLLVKHGLAVSIDKGEGLENLVQSSKDKMEEQTRLVAELISALAGGGDQNFIILLFDYIKPHLLDDGFCQFEAFQALSAILKANSWFVFSQFDQLMDILIGLESTVELGILSCRLSCLHFMFVHLLEENEEETKNKALLILNEILRFLRDSSEEVRKSAFDALLDISQSLKDSGSSSSELHHRHLFQMITGYFSGSPPQIMSVAVAAISLLIYKDAHLYSLVPDLMPTVLVLLQNKANEVIKAVLGLIKVLVTSLPKIEIRNLLPDLIHGILPWSSVSKNHFRSKVKSLIEILCRKCGIDSVLLHVPDNYKGFINQVTEFKQKARSEGTVPSKTKSHPEEPFNARKSTRALDSKWTPRWHKRKQQDGRSKEHLDKTGQKQGKHSPKKRKRLDSLGGNKKGSYQRMNKGISS